MHRPCNRSAAAPCTPTTSTTGLATQTYHTSKTRGAWAQPKCLPRHTYAHSTRGGVEEWTARRGRRGRPMPVWARRSARCHQTSGARALWVVWWPPDRLNCLLLIEAATVSRLRMQWSNWSVPSLLVRNQVILICCIACGSRPYCESRRDNMRVSRCAYGTCARTDAPNDLTPHSACTLQWLPEGKLGEVTT